MPQLLDFTSSAALTVGVELELMLVNTRDFNLAPDADDLLRRATRDAPGGELKPEITQSMVEINTSVHERYPELLAELLGTRDVLAGHARKMNVAIAAAARTRSRSGATARSTRPSASCPCRRNTASSRSSSPYSASMSTSAARARTMRST